MSIFNEELAASIALDLAKSLEDANAKVYQETQDGGQFLAVIVTVSEPLGEERLAEIRQRVAAVLEEMAPSRNDASSWGVAIYSGSTAIDGFFGGWSKR